MKRTRKGFTLVELLIVIGIMGTLGAMALFSGQEASNAARASNIADSMEKASTAMMAYYLDNSETINAKGTTAEKVAKGASAYLKSTLTDATTIDSLTEGNYGVVLTAANDATANWYLAYKLINTEATKVGAILENKATRMGLKKEATTSAADYDGSAVVYMLVR